MIRIGLTSFNEHEYLTGKKNTSLYEYAAHLPVVELDTAYYGIPRKSSVEKWVKETPSEFKFLVKVYSGISCQGDWQQYYSSEEAMVTAFLDAMTPMIESGKLSAFLIQFSAAFGCTPENVRYLQTLRQWFGDLPLAIELRNGSWYLDKYVKQTLQFMTAEKFSLVVVDEPQIPLNPVPFYPFVTNTDFLVFRFHGRNVAGWRANDSEWRKKRTLYRYNHEELSQLAAAVQQLATKVSEVTVIFNNNSGGDAAENALQFKKQLGIEYEHLNPKQLDLF